MRLVAGLTALALAVRLIDLGARPLWLDEAFSAWFSDRSFHYLWTVLPTYEAHPPLFYSLLKLWRSVVGEGHVAMRALSVLFGTLTVPVVLAIAAEQERQSPTGRPLLRGGLAGFLAACSPLLIVIGQEARPYPMLVFAYSVAILAVLRLMRAFAAGEPGQWTSWLLLGASTELVLWSHGLGFLYASCIGLALLAPCCTQRLDRERLIRGATTAAAVAMAYLPCLLMMAGRAGDWRTNWLAWSPGMLLHLPVLYTVPVEALTVGSAVAALTMALLIKRALHSTYISKGWNAERAMLLLCLGPPMLAALMSALFIPVFLPRTLSATLIPAYLMIAAAAARTSNPSERKLLTAAICMTLAPTAVAMAMRPAPERWDAVSDYLARNVAAGDEVWLYPSDTALPLESAGLRVPVVVRPLPAPFPTLGVHGPIRAGWPAMVSVTPQQAAQLASDPGLERVHVVWLVTRQSAIFDPNNDMPRALGRMRRAGAVRQWGYIAVQPFYVRAR